ncbi:hypothetical protein ACFPCV_31080 [Actinophytocola glycyrrhizae]|uniref:PPE family protein n=1 Tax=Actinophytocola glycyrrhizae TaxID=2044873 RepID=A0ABV9S9T1_9PSEU
MREPDVRWDDVSHQQIVAWTRHGLGAAATERLEERLTSVAEALADNSDDVNATLQRVDGGEWTGSAATAAAAAMRVVRDFDDILGHHGRMNVLAAFGQSDNANWARANVPPCVDVRAAQQPTGSPLDALGATADHQHQLRAAKDAEERARQVMRQYHSMTTARVAALPPLSPAPRVVITTSDGITVPSGGDPAGGHVAPRGTRSGDGFPDVVDVREAGSRPADRPPPDGPAVPAPGRTGSSSFSPGIPAPSGAPAANGGAPTTASGSAPTREPDVVRGPLPGSGQPGSGGQPGNGQPGGGQPGSRARDGRPGDVVGVHPGDRALRAGGRGGLADVQGQAARGGAPFGVTPGTAGKAEDQERRGRYAVPGSEIFEPDNDDGLLHDPFRPGSYVAPASIGDDDE